MFKKQEICFGRQPVWEALQSGQELERIFLRKGLTGDVLREIEKMATARGIPINRVPVEKLNRLTNLNHQGIVSIISPVQYFRVEDIVDQCYADGRDPLILMLDGVTDVGNFGAIARSALGLAADAIVIGHHRSSPANAQAIKASAGALYHLPVCRAEDLVATLEYLQGSGLRAVVLDGKGKSLLSETDLKGPMVLIAGSEGHGASRRMIDQADIAARLPMDERLESYNVSVATALALYEIRRQR